jgi:hypothetical protein
LRGDGILDRLARLDVNTVRLCVVGLLVATVALILVVNALDNGESRGDRSEAVVLSESELMARAGSLSHLAYWVGPKPRAERYELTSKPGEQLYIRYLMPAAAEPEDKRPGFLVVGTYAVPDAQRSLEFAASNSKQAKTLSKEDGFEMMSAPGSKHAYVVFDNQPELQVEIFSPQPGEAEKLATSGVLRPVGEG